MTEGLLLVDKAKGFTSFHLVSILRRLTGIEKIGHAGTLDPLATGLMVMLVGREYTKRSDEFLCSDKEYLATVHLGVSTDTYDAEGVVVGRSDLVPSLPEVEQALLPFQGTIAQVPPMHSAKKIGGQKLYHLARRGVTIDRPPVSVTLQIELLSYLYPALDLKISCSKGTYIRSLAHDLGGALRCGAHLSALRRTRSGSFRIEDAVRQEELISCSGKGVSALLRE